MTDDERDRLADLTARVDREEDLTTEESAEWQRLLALDNEGLYGAIRQALKDKPADDSEIPY